MSDSADEAKSSAAEPSMDDILASIRRILAEDATASENGAATGAATGPVRPGTAEADWSVADPSAVWRDDQVTEAGEPPLPAMAEGGAEVLLLTPEMRKPSRPAGEPRPPRVVSAGAADVSTDVLAQLAKAILDRRDIAVGAREVTLEGMVREMLRPLLREWLDRNLPYLIERLVKKEIDLMVNRAERLDD
jgi:hypothetical protein